MALETNVREGKRARKREREREREKRMKRVGFIGRRFEVNDL